MANWLHLLRVFWVALRFRLDDFAPPGQARRAWRCLRWIVPRRGSRVREVRLREAFQALGPVFIKFGQALSTRPDLLPEPVYRELTQLQDAVPPFPGELARLAIEKVYGGPLEDYFAHFDEQPLASASVAQVHAAELPDGTAVVVKVLRPKVADIIERDLRLLARLAQLFERWFRHESQRLKPREVVAEYAKTIRRELNLMYEAANASQLRANFVDSDLIYVPKVYWQLTRRTVMVMERIEGIPIRDVDALRAAGIDMRRLAHAGVTIFFTQAFRDGFFHADMHPGNVFVSPEGQYRAVDFGIMGSLGQADKRYLAENFLAFFERDYRRVAQAHVRAGWVPPDTDIADFEAAVRSVCEPIFARPISEISFGALLLDLFRVARQFQMPVQPQLLLLQKTVFNIEGLGRQLYPQLDLWETAKPFLDRWMSEQLGVRAARAAIRRELPNWLTLLPELPALHHQVLQQAKRGELRLAADDARLEDLRAELRRNRRGLRFGLLGLALMTASAWAGTAAGLAPVWTAGGVAAGLLLLLFGAWR